MITCSSYLLSNKISLDHLHYKSVLNKFAGCLIEKLEALNEGIMFSLKLYLMCWMVVIIHDVTSSKECIVFYSLWKLSVELVFELKCQLSRLLLLHLAVFLSFLNFVWIYCGRSVFQ